MNSFERLALSLALRKTLVAGADASADPISYLDAIEVQIDSLVIALMAKPVAEVGSIILAEDVSTLCRELMPELKALYR